MTLGRRLVCVIDDDLSMRKAIGRLLESEDYSVEIFMGAREFLARAPHTGASCVILDLNLPGLNGLELQEVFLNLIQNAFEASEEVPRARRHVIIRTERDSDRAVQAYVRDCGPGLPADQPQRVFDRFFSTKPEGMGIGLVIARSIVDAHGGTLSAENAEGGGAQFLLRLPASKETGV